MVNFNSFFISENLKKLEEMENKKTEKINQNQQLKLNYVGYRNFSTKTIFNHLLNSPARGGVLGALKQPYLPDFCFITEWINPKLKSN